MMPELQNPFTSARIVGKQVSNADYRKQSVERGHPDYVMSRSDLCEFAHCPSRWKNNYHRKDSDSTEWGTLMDAMLLGFESGLAIEPATYPPDGKKWTYQATHCKEWRKEQEADGKTVVSARDHVEAKQALAVLMDDADVAALLEQSDKAVHVEAVYEDGETGLKIPVKALIDIVPWVDSDFGRSLVDFKTSNSAFPMLWSRSVFDFNYHVQGALYLDAYTLATVKDPFDRQAWTFLHLIQESFAPWQVGKRFLSVEFLTLGRLKLTAALRDYCECLATGYWPPYERNHNLLNVRGFEQCDPLNWMITQ